MTQKSKILSLILLLSVTLSCVVAWRGLRVIVTKEPSNQEIALVAINCDRPTQWAETVLRGAVFPKATDAEYELKEQLLSSYGLPEINLHNFQFYWKTERGVKINSLSKGCLCQ